MRMSDLDLCVRGVFDEEVQVQVQVPHVISSHLISHPVSRWAWPPLKPGLASCFALLYFARPPARRCNYREDESANR